MKERNKAGLHDPPENLKVLAAYFVADGKAETNCCADAGVCT